MNAKKILIVDDDADVLEAMEEALSYEGFEVETAEGADNISALVKQHRPDLLMIDYILQGINGGELCHQLKTDITTKQIPVILISAYPKVLLALGDYGCDDFIAKPFDLYDLINKVKTVSLLPTSQPGMDLIY